MSLARDQAYMAFKAILQTNRADQKLGVDESLDRIIQSMKSDLADLGRIDEKRSPHGEYNGLAIKDRQVGDIPGYYEQALKPVLEAAQHHMRAKSVHGKPEAIRVAFDDRARFGTDTIDLPAIEQKLEDAVNTWLTVVHQRGMWDKVKLPLPQTLQIGDQVSVHPLRADPADEEGLVTINRLADVITQTDDGFVPRKFVSNEGAEKNTATARQHKASRHEQHA